MKQGVVVRNRGKATEEPGRPLGGSEWELRPEGGMRVIQVKTWGKKVSGRRNSPCKRPGVGQRLACGRNNEEARVAAAK